MQNMVLTNQLYREFPDEVLRYFIVQIIKKPMLAQPYNEKYYLTAFEYDSIVFEDKLLCRKRLSKSVNIVKPPIIYSADFAIIIIGDFSLI